MGTVTRRPLRLLLRPLLVAAALLWVPFVVIWALDVDVVWVVPSALAFLPYVVVATLAICVLSLALRARLAAGLAAVGLVALIWPRADRLVADEQPPAPGPQLVVATSNVRFGESDPARLLEIVRRERVDVLAIQEDTPDYTADATAAGLRKLLPYAAAKPAPGAKGVSLYSRYPVDEIAPTRYDFRSRGGILTLPGGQRIHIRSVHPPPPFSPKNLVSWKRRIANLPGPTAGGVPTILAGDYNATLDHHPLRELLDRGYRDAAEQAGEGWRPTWTNGRWATLTIDHVLVPSRVAVERVGVHDLPGSDHDVVLSRIRLPR